VLAHPRRKNKTIDNAMSFFIVNLLKYYLFPSLSRG
jgi:hypothetical protein